MKQCRTSQKVRPYALHFLELNMIEQRLARKDRRDVGCQVRLASCDDASASTSVVNIQPIQQSHSHQPMSVTSFYGSKSFLYNINCRKISKKNKL